MGVVTEENLKREAERYGEAGVRPQVVWPNGVLASAAVGSFVQLVTPWHRASSPTVYLEYNGNDQTLMPSPRLQYVLGKECPHYRADNVGDPFYVIQDLS